MSQGYQFRVFLSHGAKVIKVMRDAAKPLHKHGLKVWFENRMLKPRHSIPGEIEAGLKHSRVLALYLSSNACGSDRLELACPAVTSTQRRDEGGRRSHILPFPDLVIKRLCVIPLPLNGALIEGTSPGL